MNSKNIDNLFLILFFLLPISILIGPSASLINILIIDVFFLLLIFIKKDFSCFKNKAVQLLFIFYLYLIFNSLISVDKEVGLLRNLGFIRMVILFIAFNYFFKNSFFQNSVFKTWSIVLSVVLFDVFLESFTGQNLLGYGNMYGRRVVSFFKDEAIIGGFINCFYLILSGYLFLNSKVTIRTLH